MKAKKILAGMLALTTLTACVLFTGCQSLYDVAPKSYGEWDGNYVYRGNVRSKTTGEDDEYLFETVTKDGIKYPVEVTTDFTYADDDIYLCMQLRNETKEETSCLARYNVKDKTSEVIYFQTGGLSAYSIYKITDSFIILSEEYADGTLFRIDYEGNVLSSNENALRDYTDVGEYLLNCEDGKFSYRHWEEESFSPMFDVGERVNNFQVRYVEEDGKEGFLIKIHSADYKNRNLGGVYFCDLKQEKVHELVALKDKLECYLEGDYIVTGERVDGTYQRTSIDWEYHQFLFFDFSMPHGKTEILDYSMVQNCRLYKIDWTAEEELLKEVYDFTEKHEKLDFSDYTLLDDGRVFFRAQELELGGGCNGDAGIEYPYFILDPATGKLKETDVSEVRITDEKRLQNAIKSGVSCGDYIYYGEDDSYGGYFLTKVYYLCRYDTEAETSEIMQFWEEYSESKNDYEVETDEGAVRFRWSPKMWRYVDGASEFIVRNY